MLSGSACLVAAMGATSLLGPAIQAQELPRTPGQTFDEAEDRVRDGRTSANGWPIERAVGIGGGIWNRPISGSDTSFDVQIGAVETILVHVVRRYYYEIAELMPGEVVGFRDISPLARGYETNHGSGTAVDIRPGWYPPGVRDGLSAHQIAVIRDIEMSCGDVLSWGGDFPVPDQAHFEIAVGPDDPRLVIASAAIRRSNEIAGQGAGTLTVGV